MHRNKNKDICSTYKTTQRTAHRTDDNAQNSTEPQHREQHTCSAHNYRTYSLDYYHEYVAIKNSNTIELYTISKENI